jgi:hypothetical protein
MDAKKLRQLIEFQASIGQVQAALEQMNAKAAAFFDYLASEEGINDTATVIAGKDATKPEQGRPS